MAPRRAAAPMHALDQVETLPPGVDYGALEVAKALNRLADVGEAFIPAAQTVHGLGDRLDKLCVWLKGKWAVGLVIGFLVLQRTINAAPEEAPKLIAALASLAKTATGAH